MDLEHRWRLVELDRQPALAPRRADQRRFPVLGEDESICATMRGV